MAHRTRRGVLTLLPSALVCGCAWIRYPERRWQENPGPIHVFPLVIDCLLFIPGLVPGIVALAIDFGTRAIYVPRHEVARVVPEQVQALDSAVPTRAELRLLDASARVRARTRRAIDPERERQRFALPLPSDEAFTLELLVDDRLVASARVIARTSHRGADHPARDRGRPAPR